MENQSDMTQSSDDRKVPAFFNPINIGRDFREVSVDHLQVESQSIQTRWFHGQHDADLFIWLNEKGHIIKQQVSFCGQIVEWNCIDGLKTGVVIEEEVEDKRNASEVIRFDPLPHSASIRIAVDVLQNIAALEGHVRSALIQNLRKPPPMSSLVSSLFPPKAHSTATAAPESRHHSIWGRLQAWWRKPK